MLKLKEIGWNVRARLLRFFCPPLFYSLPADEDEKPVETLCEIIYIDDEDAETIKWN